MITAHVTLRVSNRPTRFLYEVKIEGSLETQLLQTARVYVNDFHITYVTKLCILKNTLLNKTSMLPKLSLGCRHNGRDAVSNHQSHDCLLNRLFGRRSNKALKLRVTCLCAGNSPVTGEFPAQRTSNAENVEVFYPDVIKRVDIVWRTSFR